MINTTRQNLYIYTYIVHYVNVFQMKWKKTYDQKNTIINMKLSKIIGLYQILDPNSPHIFGYNILHVFVTLFLIYQVIVLIFCLYGIYFWINNISQVILQLTILANFSFGSYKILILIRNKDNMRKCIEMACNDFIQYKHSENNAIFLKYRMKSLISTYVYVLMGFIILFAWSIFPLIFNDNYITLKSLDGKQHNYHLNAFNVFFPVTSGTYNRFYILFHIIEVLFGVFYVTFSHIFDSLLISMCYAISSNLKTIKNAFQTLRQKYTTNCKYIKSEIF